ncbi:MAG: hypothetical protein CME85_09055 [Henriciella sp.]|nr:hypothetical protein [Henriciella sp.]MBK75632.1 hypothetical protein [Henriciella sp.]PHR75872.1 MAG: hypothetical protein COA64_11490 [Henriciella sp.]
MVANEGIELRGRPCEVTDTLLHIRELLGDHCFALLRAGERGRGAHKRGDERCALVIACIIVLSNRMKPLMADQGTSALADALIQASNLLNGVAHLRMVFSIDEGKLCLL